MRVLILGGTTEASALARSLAGDARFQATLSYAGRTLAPRAQPVPVRSGGFGGIAGLAAVLRGFDALVDATHPFAARITPNAAAAAKLAGVPRVAVLRPAWQAEPDDRWTEAVDMAAAAAALGPEPRRVLLTVGGTDLLPFGSPHSYLVRTVDPPAFLPPGAALLTARGPFDPAAELALLRDHGTEILVTKNSGGSDGKLQAARTLGLPVVMVSRPPPPEPPVVADAPGALAWLDAHAALRGV